MPEPNEVNMEDHKFTHDNKFLEYPSGFNNVISENVLNCDNNRSINTMGKKNELCRL